MKLRNSAAALLCLIVSAAQAQTADNQGESIGKSAQLNVHGTIRSKYEYQTSEGEGRFEVRNARVSFDGSLSPYILYKAEIDLCD